MPDMEGKRQQLHPQHVFKSVFQNSESEWEDDWLSVNILTSLMLTESDNQR